ncbi:TlpA family protein disulfide reductase [Candidatus Bipolaricaulota bacterium]
MRRRTWKIVVPLALAIGLVVGGLMVSQLLATQPDSSETSEEIALPDWAQVELIDAVSGEVFTIADFAGKPILVESFAVWCSTCLRQQREMARLIELAGDAIVHVSLDTDPNEDLDKVRAHADRNDFTWLFAIAPIDMTQELIEAFGLTVVNAPRAPVILIEANGSARLLPNGVKSAEALLEEIGELPASSSEGAETS